MQLLPRFSLRSLLLIMAVFSVVSLILAQAVRGDVALGVGFLFATISLATAFAIFAALFLVSVVIAACMPHTDLSTDATPFAKRVSGSPSTDPQQPVA